MMISERIVGELISYAGSYTQADLAPLLMKHGLGAGDPGITPNLSTAKRANMALIAAMKSRKERELLKLVETALRNHEGDSTSPEWVVNLIEFLRADGFECTATRTTFPKSAWGTGQPDQIRWSVSEFGLTELPIAPLVSDLSDRLNSLGLIVASGHYRQALGNFRASNWAAANGQLRSTFESVLLDIALLRTGSRPAGGGRRSMCSPRMGTSRTVLSNTFGDCGR